MDHVKITFTGIDKSTSEILTALLADAGFNGFEEGEGYLDAYVEYEGYDPAVVSEIADSAGASFAFEIVPAQNWNAEWEKNFQPVIVEDFCTVRAHFHTLDVATPYEVVITPKMSFGTGHHATTQLVMMRMRELDFNGKSVLDFGTGTGILAILAEKLGAGYVLAIDNDEWSFENARENVTHNSEARVVVRHGSLEQAGSKNFDIILANINRHILLESMAQLVDLLVPDGTIIMSGLLVGDRPIIEEAANNYNLTCVVVEELNGWIAMVFVKS